MDAVLEAVKAALSAHLSGGAGLLAVALLVWLLKLFLDQLKSAVSDRIKEWLKSAHNLLVILAAMVVGLFLWDMHLLWGLGAFSAAVAVYFFARWRYPALLAWKPIAGGVAVALLAIGAALWMDDHQQKLRSESFDVAFLLPPDGISKEPEKVFAGLKKTLNRSFDGVERVRIVPEKLAPEDLPKYAIDADGLLAFRTTEGYPKVYIRNQYVALPGKAPDEAKLKLLLVPYQRRPAGTGIVPLEGWKRRALEGGREKMHGAELRGSFDLIAFLASKRLITLTPDAERTIWRNILAEYGEFLALHAPACAVGGQVDKLLAAAGTLTEPQVREVLNAPCAELQQDAKADTDASDRDYATQILRLKTNPSE